MITPILIDHIHWGTYLFFALLNASFLPVIYLWYPETRRRSLEEIDVIFARGFADGGRGGGGDGDRGNVVVAVGDDGDGEGDGGSRVGAKGTMRWRRGDRYVRAAREMPYLSDEAIEREQRRYGLVDDASGGVEVRGGGGGSVIVKNG